MLPIALFAARHATKYHNIANLLTLGTGANIIYKFFFKDQEKGNVLDLARGFSGFNTEDSFQGTQERGTSMEEIGGEAQDAFVTAGATVISQANNPVLKSKMPGWLKSITGKFGGRLTGGFILWELGSIIHDYWNPADNSAPASIANYGGNLLNVGLLLGLGRNGKTLKSMFSKKQLDKAVVATTQGLAESGTSLGRIFGPMIHNAKAAYQATKVPLLAGAR